MNPLLALTPEQFAALASGTPIELQIGDVQVTLNPPEKRIGKRFTSLADLSGDLMAPVEFTVEFKPGQPVTFSIRALESTVAKECDDIGAEVRPPKKKVPGPRGTFTEETDYEDETFLRKRSEVNALRTAFVITRGVVGFDIPGDDLAAKSAALRKSLPPRVIDALFAAITGLTSDPVKQADFS